MFSLPVEPLHFLGISSRRIELNINQQRTSPYRRMEAAPGPTLRTPASTAGVLGCSRVGETYVFRSLRMETVD